MRSLFVFMVFILASCESNRIFEKNTVINNNEWKAYQQFSFEFNIPDSSETYTVYCNLRNTSKYPNNNIYIQYELKDSVGNKIEIELKNFALFDPKSGSAYGKSGLGDLFEHQNILLANYKFPSAGDYTISLEQFMRYENLPEVNSVGIRVEISKGL